MDRPVSAEFPSNYDPTQHEGALYRFWEEGGYFIADPKSKKPKYVLVMPPPNVTGVLHMGHALMGTLEDILVRRKRMMGFNTLWLPGTDHAGIATQMVVEKQIARDEKKTRHELGREEFLKRVWAWKEQSQGTILKQLRMLGSSCDWSRLCFTLDEEQSVAVRETFVRLHKDGLLYRDEAMIQWCPRCRTALSDLEVKPQERKGKLWHLRYRAVDGSGELVVATTRPETLFGDTAVAVHPEDERYASLVGKSVYVPLTKRAIPVIADDYVDRAFGTGALKITPAHDANDWAVGKRHNLPSIEIFDEAAMLNEHAGAYKGLSREKAREKMLVDLAEAGLLASETDHVSNVGQCDRCGTVVEPRRSRQWFVNAGELAKDAITAVRDGRIQILPKEWEKTYFQWMENIRPWCVSRQLWWGHRIPAWHCGDCSHITVAVEAPTKCEKCGKATLKQDDDVLDTWFSSGLWPFSTLGWPKKTEDMAAFYPNDVMETGFDILFFWVARMIMLGLRMAGDIPFHTIFLHPMVRDEFGQKMSKTKGNVKDPLDIIERIGADPLRFTLCAMAVHGRDVLLSDARIDGYRNFVNKIWNASRFVHMHFGTLTVRKPRTEDPINSWIWSRFDAAARDVNQQLEQYRFFDAANRLYEFLWREYCDWYLELIKPDLEKRKAEGDTTALEVLDAALRLLHPVMPFVTETIWGLLPIRTEAASLCVAPYPEKAPYAYSQPSAAAVERMLLVVEALRSKRGESGLKPSVKIDCVIATDKVSRAQLEPFAATLERLCTTNKLRFADEKEEFDPKGFVVLFLDGIRVAVPREQLIDVAAEKLRVAKELEGVQVALNRAKGKLGSEDFLARAPANVVDGVKDEMRRLEAKAKELEVYSANLE